MKNKKHELGNEDFSIEINADWHGKTVDVDALLSPANITASISHANSKQGVRNEICTRHRISERLLRVSSLKPLHRKEEKRNKLHNK